MERLVEPMALVYIVDDEPHIRRLAAIGLKDAGFETAEFSDGSVLLHAVQQKQPDAVLLDWMMPGQDGLAVLRAMREITSPSRSASRSWPPGCGPSSGGRNTWPRRTARR